MAGAEVDDGTSVDGSSDDVGVGLAEVSGGSVDGSAVGVGVSEGSSELAPVPLASCLLPCTFRYSAMPSMCRASSILIAADREMMAKRANKSHDCRIVLSMFDGGDGGSSRNERRRCSGGGERQASCRISGHVDGRRRERL